jgi:hypothetical protein
MWKWDGWVWRMGMRGDERLKANGTIESSRNLSSRLGRALFDLILRWPRRMNILLVCYQMCLEAWVEKGNKERWS